MNNVYFMLEESAARHPERVALVFNRKPISYAVLMEAVCRLASGLRRHGIGYGDRVALMLPNHPHFAIAYFAILKLGATVVPVATHCKSIEIHHQLEEAEVKGVVFWEGYRVAVDEIIRGLERCQKRFVLCEKAFSGEIRLSYLMETHSPLHETVDTAPDDTAVIVYTDRMKGRSKGAELTHRNLAFHIETSRDFLKLSPEDGVVGVMPMYHTLGQTVVLGSFLRTGARVCLLSKFDLPNVLRAVKEESLTWWIGAPYMFDVLVQQRELDPNDLVSLKAVLSSGAPLKQETLDALENRFRLAVLEGYGLTEASPLVSCTQTTRERHAGSIGLPLPGIEMKIVDDDGMEISPGKIGEILVQGPNVMKGYLNRPEATKEALSGGWFHTGDLARLDENGTATVVARKPNLIIKSGFTLFPDDVESALLAHPRVAEAVVVGLPDTAFGEEVYACVVLKPGDADGETEIMAFLKDRIPAYQCPKTIQCVPSLPKGPTGRVVRDQVKQMLLEKDNRPKPQQGGSS